MDMAAITEPLLQAYSRVQEDCKPLQLQVLRHNAFHSSIWSKNGEVVIRLSKPRPLNPFCGIDWQLSDQINTGAPRVAVRASLFSSTVSFVAGASTVQTIMAQKSQDPGSYLQWDNTTYRWESMSCLAPLQLRLINTTTREQAALLTGSQSLPWSREQQQISIFSGQNDPVWVQVVIASGLAEAKRLGMENSHTAPRRFALS